MLDVLVADDHEVIRFGLTTLLSNAPDMRVVGVVDNGADAVELARRLHPDVVVMDLSMPVLDGISATEQVLKASPTEVRLWYSEKPEARLSTITVQGSDSAKVTLGKVRTTDNPTSIAADIADTLRPGTYLVKWKTAGRDGHALRGSYTFSIGK